ncbi:MAG: tetratricopeptide repeat protein [Desulfobulbaceae bacterium]
MTYLIALLIILLIVVLVVLFYSPNKAPGRRRAGKFPPDRIAEPLAGMTGAEEQELAPGDITEIPERAVAEHEPELALEITEEELELTLEEPALAQAELTPEVPESEAPVAVAHASAVEVSPAEEIPFILEGEPGQQPEETEVAPALAGFEDTGLGHEETPEDLAERLDFFFGSDEDAGEGPLAEGETAPTEAVAVEAEEAMPPAAEVPEEEAPPLRLEEYEAVLRRLEGQLRQELDKVIAARETGKLGLLESRLTAVCGRLADPAGSLASYQQLLEDMDRLLPAISEALPGFQATTVRRHLRSGDGEVARALLTEAALQAPEASPLAGRIRFLCGRLAEEQADYPAAGELYQQAWAAAAGNSEFLLAAGRMARILGNDEEARLRLEALLAAGGEDETLDQARYELARVYVRSEEKDRAQPLLEQALAGMEQRLGAGHPALGPVLHELAALHESSGQYEQAAPLYQRALAVGEQGLGPEHPRLAVTLGKLAGLYEEMEEEDRAEPLYERALAIRKGVLGASHPDIGILLNHLANLFKQRGEYGKAEPMFLSALEIAEKALGPDHPNLTVILNNLAELYEETGNAEKAQQYQERAFALFELPGAGGDFVEMVKDEIAIDDEKNKTITGG